MAYGYEFAKSAVFKWVQNTFEKLEKNEDYESYQKLNYLFL
jgi:hypothetical protein